MNKNFKNNSAKSNKIENEIAVILENIRKNLGEGMVAVRERPSRGITACRGIVTVYRESDLKKKSEERGYRLRPVEKYAFYASTYRPDRLGSVAIYGDGAYRRSLLLKSKDTFYGYPILAVTVEIGMRPFVDVKLAS